MIYIAAEQSDMFCIWYADRSSSNYRLKNKHYSVRGWTEMSRGSEFLAEVTAKLKKRIQEIDAVISEGQKEIEDMNEYYWENYTEMDQYGYENFDNQQALLMQVNANQESKKRRSRLKKMLDAPFFGSVDFIYEGEEEPESFYIGIGNFAERKGSIPLVYDWRAPVSGLFYDYDKGEASYQAPGGCMDGEITAKWQYKIRRGKMVYEFESDVKIDDDILKQELGANSDVQLKNIVRTIQKEQNAIIRNTQDKILVIQGAAGSGKTSVALHRIAYLLYHDREHLRSSDILILSPNSVFSDYISHVLPELGEENIREMSFDVFAYHELKGIVTDCEDRYHHLERRMVTWDLVQQNSRKVRDQEKARPEKAEDSRQGDCLESGYLAGNGENMPDSWHEDDRRYRWKQSRAFISALEGFLVELEDRLIDFKDVEYRGLSRTAEELTHLFYYKFPDTPLLSRLDEVMAYFVDEYETLRNCTLAEEELEKIREKFMKMYVTTDLYEIYNWFLEENDWPLLLKNAPEKRVLEYEDVYPMLYLKYRLCRGTDHRRVKHLVIDEMQDYSYLQYVILERLFSCNMTILGDRAQTMDEEVQDVLKFLPRIFGKRVRRIEMKKSYRNTLEIAQYASRITGVDDIEFLQRHGREVCEETYETAHSAMDELLSQVKLGDEEYETAAVLFMTEKEALNAYLYLKEKREEVYYIDRDSSSFRKGITVTTFYLAKGLEFDQVFVLGGRREHPVFGQFRYICATRALHELYIYDLKGK